jgi:hypothetical protein
MASSAGGGQHRAAAQVFCRSQFNLANEACSLRTINTGTNPARPLNSNVSSYDEMQSSEHHDREHLHSSRRAAGASWASTTPASARPCLLTAAHKKNTTVTFFLFYTLTHASSAFLHVLFHILMDIAGNG